MHGPTDADPRLTRIAVRSVQIVVADGPDEGRTVRVATPVFVVGSGELADLRLQDSKVSRVHLRLHLGEDGVALHDDGSRNGTWIGGLRVHHAMLTTGTQVRVGGTTLAIEPEKTSSPVEVSASTRFGDAIGVSSAMRVVFALLERASPTDLTVLLEGESGVGKEILARAVHAGSTRASGPFVTVDCGAVPRHLIESELFGHLRGAFTGADASRSGLFADASGGTLFLDEIGELELDLQPKLLRALEQREIRPVGATRSIPIDVRVVAATNRPLAAAVRSGEFREDLFYRLSVVRVQVPALRDRSDDVLPIARAMLRSYTRSPSAELPPDVEGMLVGYRWPGNVRELRNVVQRFATLGVDDAASLFASGAARAPGVPADLSEAPYAETKHALVEDFDRSYLKALLARCDGSIARAIEHSGLSRATLYRMLERHQLLQKQR